MSTFERFILIDDNEADNVFHEIMIRRTGFKGEILIFYSGLEALAFFKTDPLDKPTCILLDINMPMMSGFELAEEASTLLADKHNLVLVMLTTSTSPADQTRAQSIPIIQGYVPKPLTVPVVSGIMAGVKPAFRLF